MKKQERVNQHTLNIGGKKVFKENRKQTSRELLGELIFYISISFFIVMTFVPNWGVDSITKTYSNIIYSYSGISIAFMIGWYYMNKYGHWYGNKALLFSIKITALIYLVSNTAFVTTLGISGDDFVPKKGWDMFIYIGLSIIIALIFIYSLTSEFKAISKRESWQEIKKDKQKTEEVEIKELQEITENDEGNSFNW